MRPPGTAGCSGSPATSRSSSPGISRSSASRCCSSRAGRRTVMHSPAATSSSSCSRTGRTSISPSRAASGAGRTRHSAAAMLRRVRFLARAANLLAAPDSEFKPIQFNHVPVDAVLCALARAATESNLRRYELISRYIGSLLNPSRVTAEDFRWLLSQGGEKEPRRVVEQFARWIRHDEMKCYRTGYDYKTHFRDIAIPMAIFFGDLDKIASAHSTRGIYRAARSEYLLWRPVKENSHLELTMGTDIHQIRADVKDLVEYAARRTRPGPVESFG